MPRLSFRAAPTAALLLAALSGCSRTPAAAPAPTPTTAPARATYATGADVLATMRAQYDGKWYNTLTFKQKTSRLTADGKWNVQTWYEAMKIPGSLRIDFDPISAANGVIYTRDSVFTVNGGRALRGVPGLNPLLLLGFDVYGNAPARTAALLRKEGFDLSKVHADTFQGRPMIVVGARAGDMKSKQFWVDAERLYFVRTLEPAPRDATKVQDVRFVNYRREGDAWISPRVEIHTDGKLVFFEDYSDIRTNVVLDDALFDPSKWKTTKHWVTP
ncbi:MAG: hypothetical protein ABI664_15730 [bacterium]